MLILLLFSGLRRGAVDVIEGRYNRGDVFVFDEIVKRAVFAAEVDDSLRTQAGQMLRQGGLADIQMGEDIRHAHFTLREQAKDHQPARIRQILEKT